MCREVYAHEVALAVKLLYSAPRLSLRYGWRGYLHFFHRSEQRLTRLVFLLLIHLSVAHKGFEERAAVRIARKEALALDLEAVERSAEHKALERLAVYGREIDALHKVEYVFILSVLLALVDDGLSSGVAHALDGSEAETHLAFLVGAELLAALVNVRAHAGYAHGLTFVHQLGYLRYVVKASAHVACHEFCRIVGLEIGRLISHPRIARGVTLVEGVRSKLLPVGPYLLEHLRVVSVFLSALDKLRLHGVNDVLLLLTHGLTQGVALASGEVGKLTRQKHDLLLIHRDAVSVLQIFLHAGNIILYLLLAVLSGNERGDVVHRSWAIEGVHGYEVLKYGRLKLAQILLHAGRLKLECAHGAAFLIELISKFVVDRYVVEVYLYALREAYVLYSLLKYGQCAESEEVHLYQSGLLDDVSVVLCGKELVARVRLVFGRADGHPVADGVAADNGSAGVYTCSAHGALKHLCIFYRIAELRVGTCLSLAQLGHALNGIGQVHLQAVGQTVGDGLAQMVRHVERQLLHARHVLNGVLCGHGAVGDDVRHLVVSVFVFHPFEHLSASVVIEVGIDIGQRYTVGVEETLKQKVVFNRVYLRNAQTVGHNRTGG